MKNHLESGHECLQVGIVIHAGCFENTMLIKQLVHWEVDESHLKIKIEYMSYVKNNNFCDKYHHVL